VAAAATMFVMVWSRLPPIRVITSVVTPEWVAPGEKVTITRAVSTLRPGCEGGTLVAKLVDSEHHVRGMELPAGSRPPPITGDITSSWMIPDTTAAGTATYSSVVTYPCFPFYSWWPISVALPEVQFTVKQPEAQYRLQSR
jgi:hypothetical protein